MRSRVPRGANEDPHRLAVGPRTFFTRQELAQLGQGQTTHRISRIDDHRDIGFLRESRKRAEEKHP